MDHQSMQRHLHLHVSLPSIIFVTLQNLHRVSAKVVAGYDQQALQIAIYYQMRSDKLLLKVIFKYQVDFQR